jgi:hypothetical protein
MSLIILTPYRGAVVLLPSNTFATGYGGQAFATTIPLKGSADADIQPFIYPNTVTMAMVGSADANIKPFIYPEPVTMSVKGSAA